MFHKRRCSFCTACNVLASQPLLEQSPHPWTREVQGGWLTALFCPWDGRTFGVMGMKEACLVDFILLSAFYKRQIDMSVTHWIDADDN